MARLAYWYVRISLTNSRGNYHSAAIGWLVWMVRHLSTEPQFVVYLSMVLGLGIPAWCPMTEPDSGQGPLPRRLD